MSDCLTYSIRHISRYPKTKSQLQKKLVQRGYEQEEIEETMMRLEELSYINDSTYTELYLRSEVVRKGKPFILIQQKLLQKGVARELVDEVSEDMNDELHAGMKEKVFKILQKDGTDQKTIQKLVRKGYAYTLVLELKDQIEEEITD